jgi:hypothetical protein
MKPPAGTREIALNARYVTERPQCDEILGIEIKGLLKNQPSFTELLSLVQRLRQHDVPADMPGLVWQVRAADRDRLNEVTLLAVLVGVGREIPSRIFLEFLF